MKRDFLRTCFFVISKPANHYKRWTKEELQKLKDIASTLKSKQDMYEVAEEIAKMFGRGVPSVCKKIEEFNGWAWYN